MRKINFFINHLKNKIKFSVNSFFRIRINRKKQKRLKNKDITLIASNCNGCLILHDLGLRYNSPFVNLYIEADDYIKLLQSFEYYMSLELKFVRNIECEYPIAALDDVLLYCVHYKDEKEVIQKWNERKQRMDMSNCFIMFTDRDGCSQKNLEVFDTLPFKNKVVFTNTLHKDIKSSFYISGFENDKCVGSLYHYKGWNGKKYYDDFDYVTWFNGELFQN